MASLDFSNAFNSIDRPSIRSALGLYAPEFYRATSWAYNKPSLLVTQGDGPALVSAAGVRQGDPLGPFLFSLAVRPTLEKLASRLARVGGAVVGYLDDWYILSRQPISIEQIEGMIQPCPLKLNVRKSRVDTVERLRETGLCALGTCLGPLEARQRFLEEKATSWQQAIAKLSGVPKHHALTLLRQSSHLLLRHLQRSLDPEGLGEVWAAVDQTLLDVVKSLMGDVGAGCPSDAAIISLPAKMGGLGIPRFAEMAPRIYPVARRQCRAVAEKIVGVGWQDEVEEGVTSSDVAEEVARETREKLLRELSPDLQHSVAENASYLGHTWLTVAPTSKPITLSDSEVACALRQRFLRPPRHLGLVCPSCSDVVRHNHHDVCRAGNRQWVNRHDRVRDLMVEAFKGVEGVTAGKEPRVAAGSELRADFGVQTVSSREYYDVQIVALNAPSALADHHQTLTKAADKKRAKYEVIGPNFHPMILSAGGLMEKTTAQDFKKLQRLVGRVAGRWMGTMISVGLLKARARAMVSVEDPEGELEGRMVY